MKQIQMRSLLLSIILLVMACAVCRAADEPADKTSAQTQNAEKLMNLDAKDMPLPEVLQMLFKNASFSYTVDPKINQLKVTVAFRDVTFETALKNLLRSAGATYRMENGVYNIAPRIDNNPAYSPPGSSIQNKPAASATTQNNEKLINIDVKDMPLSEVLQLLFKDSGLNYAIDPGINQLKVTAVYKDVSFETVLKNVVKAAGATYRVDNGIYLIAPRIDNKPAYSSQGSSMQNKPIASAPTQNNEKLINIDVKDTPLSEVLQMLFNASGFSYKVAPPFDLLRVTAVIKDIPFDAALKQVVRAAGVDYNVDNGVYNIGAHFSNLSQLPLHNSSFVSSFPTGSLSLQGDLKVEKILLANLESGDVINAVGMDGSVMIVSTGSNYIIIKGTESNIAATCKLIRLLDTPDALPRAVRVKLTIKATVTEQGKKPKLYEATTESVGVQGVKMPLQIQADKITERVIDKKSQFSTNGLQISVYLTPALASEVMVGSENGKIITLSGQGQIGGSFPFTFSKVFDVTVSAAPSERVVIAAGSANISSGKVEFQVTAVTTVEKGRVRFRPSSQEGSGSGVPRVPNGNNAGSSYGGHGENGYRGW